MHVCPSLLEWIHAYNPVALWSLALLMFTEGFALMAIEVLAARMIAPYFGSGVFTWGAVLTAFMTGLASGSVDLAVSNSDSHTISVFLRK